MARNEAKIPFFTWRARADGSRRYFWQPSRTLRLAGYQLKRLADDRALAIAQCLAETDRVQAEIAARRDGAAPAPDAARPRRSIDPNSVDAMLRAYEKSDAYKCLAASTRRGYDVAIAALKAWCGDQPVDAITPRLAAAWLAKLAIVIVTDRDGNPVLGADRQPLTRRRDPHAAAIGRTARAIWYAHRLANGRVKSAQDVALNPFAHQRLSGKAAGREDPESILWSDDAIAAYVAAADRIGLHSIGTAIALNAWLGQRMTDVLRIPAEFQIEITLRQNKTGAQRALPIGLVPALVARAEAERAEVKARRARTERAQTWMHANGRNAWPGEFEGAPFVPLLPSPQLLISEATGLPYATDHFRKKFGAVRDQVIADHPDRPEWHKLTFMHLRHTAVTRMGEAGCDDAEISAISGHSLETVKAILERYLVRTRKMGRNAFRKRLAAAEQGEG